MSFSNFGRSDRSKGELQFFDFVGIECLLRYTVELGKIGNDGTC